tara:strand:- start:191 stop:427 length:237 start_codon:yes stop_codon:yes gene_type:complete
MGKNFDTHKWFKKQYLEEAGINESWLGPEQIDRFEGTANGRELGLLQDMIKIVGTDWMQEGFEKGDIKEYINHLIDEI